MGSVFGVSGRFGGFLRFIVFFLLGLVLLGSLASAATIVYSPVRDETVVWYYDGKWRSLEYDALFLGGVRETTVAQAMFDVPEFDWSTIESVTYRVFIPQTFGIQSLSYIKVYGAAGDPPPLSLGGPAPGRSLLYSSQPSSKISQVMEFDLTYAMRKAAFKVGEAGQLRLDFTAYLSDRGTLPLANAELIVRTVPEPTAPLLLSGALGLGLSSRRVALLSRSRLS